MKVLRFGDIFNDQTLNIFTDASISKLPNGSYRSCPGLIAYVKPNRSCFSHIRVLENSTNNEGEIYAIFDAVQYAALNKQYKINIFSDSLISVKGLKEWIYGWINNSRDKILYNASGQPVSNQYYFLAIISYILSENISLNLYHIHGHINSSNKYNLINTAKQFIQINKLDYDTIDLNLIKTMVDANNRVDNMTRTTLESPPMESRQIMLYISPNIDLERYGQLINVKR